MLAAALAMVGHAFPAGPARIRATGIWAGALGGRIAAGPLLSSVLARHGDWRAAYWLEAALMSATMAWAGRLTEPYRDGGVPTWQARSRWLAA